MKVTQSRSRHDADAVQLDGRCVWILVPMIRVPILAPIGDWGMRLAEVQAWGRRLLARVRRRRRGQQPERFYFITVLRFKIIVASV